MNILCTYRCLLVDLVCVLIIIGFIGVSSEVSASIADFLQARLLQSQTELPEIRCTDSRMRKGIVQTVCFERNGQQSRMRQQKSAQEQLFHLSDFINQFVDFLSRHARNFANCFRGIGDGACPLAIRISTGQGVEDGALQEAFADLVLGLVHLDAR